MKALVPLGSVFQLIAFLHVDEVEASDGSDELNPVIIVGFLVGLFLIPCSISIALAWYHHKKGLRRRGAPRTTGNQLPIYAIQTRLAPPSGYNRREGAVYVTSTSTTALYLPSLDVHPPAYCSVVALQQTESETEPLPPPYNPHMIFGSIT